MFRHLANVTKRMVPHLVKTNENTILNQFPNFHRTQVSIQRKMRINDTYFVDKDKKKSDRIIKTPFVKGIVVKLIKLRPKKPNSGNRRCVVARLNNNKLVKAYIPGENGQIQEHGMVLIYVKRKQDVPGLKYRVVRHKLDMK